MSSRRTFAACRNPDLCYAAYPPASPEPGRRIRTFASLLPLLLLCLIHSARAQTTIHVPTDQPTIQAGINAASNGDTVLVAPGTYYENINFNGKAITVTSSAGPATTIIDGSSIGPAVTFKSSEPRAAVLSNFTIQHGGNFENIFASPIVSATGGIYVNNSSPEILNNVITQDNCWGVQTYLSAPLIQGNTISATQDPNGYCSFGGGAGIYLEGDLNGSNGGAGDGIPPFVFGNTIENNVESGNEDAGGNGGAGIAVWGGAPLIENNIIRNNNSPGGSGGGINIVRGYNITIVQNLIYGNQAGCGGGALAFVGGPIEESNQPVYYLFANNTVVNNTGQAPGIHNNCENISQLSPTPGVGESGPAVVFVNNIISGASSYDPAINCSSFYGPSEWYQPIFDHNILYNSTGVFFGSYCVDVSTKYGNIAADPQFLNPSANDYRLQPSSPAIDAGNNSALQLITQMSGAILMGDFDNNQRLQDATGKGYPIIDIGAYEYLGLHQTTPTTLLLTASAYSGPAGSNYTLTATFSSVYGSPTGSTTFFMDGAQIGVSTISAGVATLSNVLINPGVHSLYAAYPGQGGFTPAISVVIIIDISNYSTNLSLTSSPDPSLFGQSVTFTVTTYSADSTFIPSPITLTDTTTNTTLASLTPNSSGIATYTISALAVGNHLITATYAGDATHSFASASVNQTVDTGPSTTTSLNSSLNPAPYGQSVTFVATVTNISSTSGTPTGTITFTDGTTVVVTQPLTSISNTAAAASFSTSTLSVGTHPITATYNPTGGFSASTASLTEIINGLASATTLTAAPNPALFGQTVTLTAAVTGIPATPTGSLTFYNGPTALAIVSLDASGHAAFTTSSLAVGTHTLTAVYAGNTIYSTSTSLPFSETINPLPANFTIILASPTVTIETQHHLTTSLVLTSLNSFADTLTLTCANLPTYVTCQPTPNPAPLAANGSTTVSLYLDTDSVLGYALNHRPSLPGDPTSSRFNLALLITPVGLFAGLAAFSRRRTRLRLLLVFLALIPASLSVVGCGEIIYPYDPPPSAVPGTYIIPITATGAATGITHTAQLTLIITQ
jgi:hypothetical protein